MNGDVEENMHGDLYCKQDNPWSMKTVRMTAFNEGTILIDKRKIRGFDKLSQYREYVNSKSKYLSSAASLSHTNSYDVRCSHCNDKFDEKCKDSLYMLS